MKRRHVRVTLFEQHRRRLFDTPISHEALRVKVYSSETTLDTFPKSISVILSACCSLR